ncbi:MAG: heme ABC exporter ATP-binding protein CcmA [Desulfobacterales bacterium]|nr:heme ABC exporter ATP-binding protein CcmA [Desulfobacterales bacterium]
MNKNPGPFEGTATARNDDVIEAKGLNKTFGFKPVLCDIDLVLKSGDFLTLLGPNGAGKTTLIHILCALMRPTSGTVSVAGYDTRYHLEQLHRLVGVISHHTFLYGNLSAFENLKFYGQMFNVLDLNAKIKELLDFVGLTHVTHAHVQTFSRGMQQRLSVARAVIHDPAILFLDEPYTGLDEHGAQRFTTLLDTFRRDGKTILMTSHNLDQGLELCNKAAILKSGRLIVQKEVSKSDKIEFKHIYMELTQEKASSEQVA